MKNFKDILLEKLKVTKNIDLHICKVELDHFIPWVYGMPYYRISDLVPDDLIFLGAPFKDTMQKDFNNDPEKLYAFFLNHVKTNPIIEVESIEDYPGVWEFEFTLDGITFKTHKKYEWPLDELKSKYPTDTTLNFYINESKINEKLKITKGSNKTGEELFTNVIDALKDYPKDEVDVESLNLTCSYMHDKMSMRRPVDNIFFHIDWTKNGTKMMVVVLDNGVMVRIDSFKTFNELVLSETGESSEEILNNILDLLNE